ncbi:PadR family transcriptional regulator [Actinacidiphila rubida]|uniref:DNA-binding transcriptional regulator, PadR family n=1 Tax=Actinacidiphila rubida TaxID=310780 RepID=A0A1H8RSB0_9ACTN|nr:PadR family transcriptional regulator [Actinacidiphila rubida]SEO69064.1 DNA-binding transcriptional regulator, PadR family [Actinacidiphila rubida]
MSVRHALLALLSEGPKYGLQLRQEFEARTGEVWPLNVGQVYSTVQRLERDGLAESDPGDAAQPGPQRRYRITTAGGAELTAWLHTPPGTDAPPRDELLIKVLVALRLPEVDVPELLQAHRRHTIMQMQQYTRLKEHAGDDVSLLLVADAQLFRLESLVRWLDVAQARLRDHVPPAPAAGAGTTGGSASPDDRSGSAAPAAFGRAER